MQVIEFGPRFSQLQFDNIFSKNVPLTLSSPAGKIVLLSQWDISFLEQTTVVVFDLSLTEWVSTEQIAFLFAWIRNVKLKGKKVTVRLPYRNHLENLIGVTLNKARYEKLATRYKEKDILFQDNDYRIKRRRRSNTFLMAVYGLFTRVGLGEDDFENMADTAQYNRESRMVMQNDQQIIPFTVFDVAARHQHIKHDTHFNDIINNHPDAAHRSGKVFELQNEIQGILRNSFCYSPFESKILSSVITQELYLNSLQHSFMQGFTAVQQPEECYATSFLSKRWDSAEGKHFVTRFTEEKYPASLDFFKDKETIKNKINERIAGIKERGNLPSRIARLTQYSDYKNISFLEFTFLDFGTGIHQTLAREFENSIAGDSENRFQFSESFHTANRDSQIIEYAFLLDTSRNPLDKTIDNYELVPRGLYFLADMVRRYKGLLVVRSGYGKVIFDFSDKIYVDSATSHPTVKISETYAVREAIYHVKNEDIQFPGTLYTIVLPERDEASEKHLLSVVRAEDPALAHYIYSLRNPGRNSGIDPNREFATEEMGYISLLFLYNRIIESIQQEKSVESDLKEIYNRLFKAVNDELDKYVGTNCILFFDFSGLAAGNPAWIKILYFLTNTPKINEKTRAIVINLPPDERQIIQQMKLNLRNSPDSKGEGTGTQHLPFLYRPIPCIHFRIEYEKEDDLINWIGLRSEADEKLLTDLFIGRKQAYNIERQKMTENAEGSLFVKNDGWISSSVAGLSDLRAAYFALQQKAVANFLISYIEKGRANPDEKEKHVYLVANGGYQYNYLSLYELLHDKYIARYFASCLLDKYCFYVEARTRQGIAITHFGFDKIIAVTVSSQLIGVAIRDLIEEDKRYQFLRKEGKKEGGADSAPELIMLSSYYSFDSEKPFEKIKLGDRVLVVNDVISTGNLIKQLKNKIEHPSKAAIINAVFSICDSRIPHDVQKESGEKKYEYFEGAENLFFTLAAYSDGIELRKYNGPYKGTAEVKRINPLLNNIIEMSSVHGEQHKILFPHVASFIGNGNITSKHFKIGHFQQNLTHNGYLTHMRPLFSTDEGQYVLRMMKTAIDGKFEQEPLLSGAGRLQANLITLQTALDGMKNASPEKLVLEQLTLLDKEVHGLRQLIDTTTKGPDKFLPDFIFYPVFSGIERMGHYAISTIFGTHQDNIIGLQRFDTPKGWRFPFPAKRFNRLTKNKTVLILDSGSLTGESLVQLIDNIGFLDVKEMIVLSVITRIEDFYREFYSRLKSLKVKRLKSAKATTQHEPATDKDIEHIIPVTIFFGVSLHIPVYSSSVSCPFCEELRLLDSVRITHSAQANADIVKYIENRKNEILLTGQSTGELADSAYLPVDTVTKLPDIKSIFIVRDLLGMIDSYRFYRDFSNYFDELVETVNQLQLPDYPPVVRQKIELILTCILHEGHLFELVDNLINNLGSILADYLLHVIAHPSGMASMYYEWSNPSIVRLCFRVLKEKKYQDSIFDQLVRFDTDARNSYIQYYIWDTLFGKSRPAEEKTMLEGLILRLDEKGRTGQLPVEQKRLIKILSESYRLDELTANNYLIVPFYNLRKFVMKGQYQARHFFLVERLNGLIDRTSSKDLQIEKVVQSLKEVMHVLQTDIKPNIDRILFDDDIKKCVTLYMYLGRDKPGIMYYIKRMKGYHDELEKLLPPDAAGPEALAMAPSASTTQIMKDIREDASFIVNNVLREDKTYNNFYRVCYSYPCDYGKILSEKVIDQPDRINFFSPTVLPQEFDNIACHSFIFEEIVSEIIKNAAHCTSDENTLTVSVAAEDRKVVFSFVQDEPFKYIEENGALKNKDHNGGLKNIVEKYVMLFDGEFTDNRDESESTKQPYIITIKFKIHEYSSGSDA